MGYRRALLVLCVVPIAWSLPTALMVGELSSALPEEGGYYAWVTRALGPFWGFQEAWLSLVASIFDMALYPTIFVLYLSRWLPGLSDGWPAFLTGALMIAICVAWNLLGTRAVGVSSVWLAAALLLPFLALTWLGLHRGMPAEHVRTAHAGVVTGLLVAMWNFMGWDNASTFVHEVERPRATYPLAMVATVMLVTGSYMLPVWGAQHAGLRPEGWATGSWVTAGAALGGPALAFAIVLGGVLSPLGSFGALLLSYSRVPAALAHQGLLPAIFGRLAPRTGAPFVAVMAAGALYITCLSLGFDRLVALDVLLYGLSLLLEFVALIVLRVREPELLRPFRMPGGTLGAAAISALPMGLLALACAMQWRSTAEPRSTLVLSLLLAALGGPAYFAAAVARRRRQATARQQQGPVRAA